MMLANESLKMMAESVGITNLGEDACRELSTELAFTLHSLLLDAQKFARKSKRRLLTTSDIDYALKMRSMEPVYGFSASEPMPFRAANLVGGTGGGRSIYYTEEQVVDLEEVIKTNNTSIKLPNDLVINAHWLCIEGVQPSVPENPQIISRDMQKKDGIEPGSAKPVPKQNEGENYVKLKSLLPHELAVEQQIYYKEITEACVGGDELKRTEALNSLSTDPGLHQLLPRFVLFITEGVRFNILQCNMAILIYLMRMAKSLIENKAIYLEKYLHHLLPAIMSCVLSKQLCARPDLDNHYALREFCSRLVAQIIKIYGSIFTNLQSRVINVYLNALQSDKATFSTVFGALVGFSDLGNEVCEKILFSLVKDIGERVAPILDSPATSQEKLPAEKVKTKLVELVSNILNEKNIKQSGNEFDYLTTEFGAYFGQMIHSQLIKLRSGSQLAGQNNIGSSNNLISQKTPMNNRVQSFGMAQQQTHVQYITPKPLTNQAGIQRHPSNITPATSRPMDSMMANYASSPSSHPNNQTSNETSTEYSGANDASEPGDDWLLN